MQTNCFTCVFLSFQFEIFFCARIWFFFGGITMVSYFIRQKHHNLWAHVCAHIDIEQYIMYTICMLVLNVPFSMFFFWLMYSMWRIYMNSFCHCSIARACVRAQRFVCFMQKAKHNSANLFIWLYLVFSTNKFKLYIIRFINLILNAMLYA